MANVDETTAKVQRFLVASFGSVSVDEEGFFVSGGADRPPVWVRIRKWLDDDEGQTTSLVYLWTAVGGPVPPTPELYEWIASSDQWFGALGTWTNEEEGTVQVKYDYALLGSFLDREELFNAVMSVHFGGKAAEKELVERFGGKRWIDE